MRSINWTVVIIVLVLVAGGCVALALGASEGLAGGLFGAAAGASPGMKLAQPTVQP